MTVRRKTPATEAILVGAAELSRSLGHDHIDSGHLLAALVTNYGPAGQVLRARSIDPDSAREAVAETYQRHRRRAGLDDGDVAALAALHIDIEQMVATMEDAMGEGALARRAPRQRRRFFRRGHHAFAADSDRALLAAGEEAAYFSDDDCRPEHILLAIAAGERGPGYDILDDNGLDVNDLRALIFAQRGGDPVALAKLKDATKELDPEDQGEEAARWRAWIDAEPPPEPTPTPGLFDRPSIARRMSRKPLAEGDDAPAALPPGSDDEAADDGGSGGANEPSTATPVLEKPRIDGDTAERQALNPFAPRV
jgi:hypothetical protein